MIIFQFTMLLLIGQLILINCIQFNYKIVQMIQEEFKDKEEILKQCFELIRVLGEGSFGKVYLIRNRASRKQFALKRYNRNHLQKRGKYKMLVRSIYILQSLKHPSIIKFINYIISPDESTIYLLFQACKKGSLDQIKPILFKRRKTKLIKFILYRLAQALHYMRQSNVAHRDIKPSNITFNSKGQLKIIDFDEAVCFDQHFANLIQSKMLTDFGLNVNQVLNLFHSQKNRASTFVGTQIYMSPEMIQSTIGNEKGDLWAFGCIIYELFVGSYLHIEFDTLQNFNVQLSNRISILKQYTDPLTIQFFTAITQFNPLDRIQIEDVLTHHFFDDIREPSALKLCQEELIHILKGNYGIIMKNSLDSCQIEVIGMNIGKEVFELLKTVVLIRDNQGYQITNIIAGPKYFKLSNCQDDSKKEYILYEDITSIFKIEDHIVILTLSNQTDKLYKSYKLKVPILIISTYIRKCFRGYFNQCWPFRMIDHAAKHYLFKIFSYVFHYDFFKKQEQHNLFLLPINFYQNQYLFQILVQEIQKIQMNLKQRSNKRCFMDNITDFITKHIPIQQKKRTRLTELIIYTHYILDYLILWTIIMQAFISFQVFNSTWIVNIFRIIIAILFIIFQHPFFFMMNKMVIFTQVLICQNTQIQIELLNVGIQIVMCGVWALTKQQRMIHFDSRLYLFPSFTKQFVIYSAVLGQYIFQYFNFFQDRQFLVLAVVIVVGAIDLSEMIYNDLTKVMFTRLDQLLILLGIIMINKDMLGITNLQYLFSSLMLFLIVILHMTVAPASQSKLMSINYQEIKKLEEDDLAMLLIDLKRNLADKNTQKIETFIYKLKQECEDVTMIQKIGQYSFKDIQGKRDLLSNFIFRTLKKAAKNSTKLRDLVVYLYSPNPRLYCCLDLNQWYHLREYQRILAQQTDDATLKQAEAQKELAVVKEVINRFIISCECFLQQLMRERINETKIQKLGEEVVMLIEELYQIYKSQQSKTYEIQDIINLFVLECLPLKYQQIFAKKIEGFEIDRENYGELFIGSEEDNYLKILQANNSFTKIAYKDKNKYCGIHLSNILPAFYVSYISEIIEKKMRSKSKIEKIEENFIFLYNSNGYAVICSFKLQPTTHKSGRAWKLSLRPQHFQKSYLIMNSKGILEGVTQISRYFGFIPEHTNKQLNHTLIKDLRTKSFGYLSKGQFLFSSHLFYFQNDLYFTIVQEIKVGSEKIFVIEVGLQARKQLKSVMIPINKPVQENNNFEFFYEWSGRITNQYNPIQLAFTASFHEYKRKLINYGENITEMRYFQNKIDYKSNFQEERDCQSLQLHHEQTLSSITINEYYEKWDRKNQNAPLWFKAIIAVILLLSIASIASGLFAYTQYNNITSQSKTDIQIIAALHQKLQSVVLLGELTTFKRFNTLANENALINQQITATNSISNQIYQLSQNIFTQTGGQDILGLLNSLNLAINSYLLNSNSSASSILTLISTQIVPIFLNFIDNFVTKYEIDSGASNRIVALVSTGIGSFVLICILWALQWRISVRQKEVTEILKFVSNEQLEAIRQKAIRFKQVWLENADSKQIEQPIENQDKQNETSAPKHMVPQFQLNKFKALHIIWLICVMNALVSFNSLIVKFTDLSSSYISFEDNLQTQITYLQAIWAQLNNNSPNVTSIKNMITQNLNSEYKKNVFLKYIASNSYVSIGYISTYNKFWETINICTVNSDPHCNTFLNGAIVEGGNMIICYLNRQHDAYLINNMSNFSLTSQPTANNLARIYYDYLTQMASQNSIMLIKEFQNQITTFQQQAISNFVLIVVAALSIFLLLIYYVRIKRKCARIQELLMVMPFQTLKNIPSFHRFYLKYYVQY